jgi:hypothetical protein
MRRITQPVGYPDHSCMNEELGHAYRCIRSTAAPITRRLSYRQVQAIAHLIQGLAWVGVALTTNAVIVGILFVFLGAGSSLVSVAVGSARQALTPDELLGRVVSAFRLLGLGATGLGALVGGVVADWQG